MRNMLRILKGARGFTLMELLVVVGILGVLTAVVAPAVSGTKGTSQDGQVKSDGKAASTAVDNYNNKSIDNKFPDTELTATGHRYESAFTAGAARGLAVSLRDSGGIQIGTLANSIKDRSSGIKVLERTVLNFGADTDIYQADGSIGAASFVPDFLQKEPDSLKLVSDDTRKLDDNIFKEYLWTLKRTSPGSEQEARTLQVFRLVDAVCYSGGTLQADGKGQTGSVRRIAEDAFIGAEGAVDSAGTGGTGVKGTAAALSVKNTALSVAIKLLKEKEATLADKQRLLDQAVAAGVVALGSSPLSAAETARNDAKTLRDNAKGVAAVTGATPTAATGLFLATDEQVTAQSNFDLALGALKSAQDQHTGNAIAANAKCEGSNKVISLTYKRVF